MRVDGLLRETVRVIPEIRVDSREGQHVSLKNFGIGEIVYLSLDPAQKGEWRLVAGQGQLTNHAPNFPGEARYVCPPTAQPNVTLHFRVGKNILATVQFEVIMPIYRLVKYRNIHFSELPHYPNAGFLAAFVLTPDTVSFARVALRELSSRNTWMASIDTNLSIANNRKLNSYMTKGDRVTMAPILNSSHAEPPDSETWAWYFAANRVIRPIATRYSEYKSQHAICEDPQLPQSWRNKRLIRTIEGVSGTVMFRDFVYNPIWTTLPEPWLAAANQEKWAKYYLDIPVAYKTMTRDNDVKPGPADTGTLLAENRHSFLIRKNGTLTVSKGPKDNPEEVTFAIDAGPENPLAWTTD